MKPEEYAFSKFAALPENERESGPLIEQLEAEVQAELRDAMEKRLREVADSLNQHGHTLSVERDSVDVEIGALSVDDARRSDEPGLSFTCLPIVAATFTQYDPEEEDTEHPPGHVR